LERLIQLTEM